MGQKKTSRDKLPAGLPAAQMGSLNTRTSRTGRVIKAPKAFAPAPTTVPAKKRKGGSRKKDANIVCIHCNRGHSPANNAIVFCDGCNDTWHQKCHDPPIDNQVVLVEDMEWHCSKCKPAPPGKDKPKFQFLPVPNPHPRFQPGPRLEVGGDCFTVDERRAYLSRLSHAHLVELVVKITSEYPYVPMLPADMKALPASQFFGLLEPTHSAPTTSTTTASAPAKISGKRTRADEDPFDDDVPANPPKRSRTTSTQKMGLGDIPSGDDDAVATSTTTASAPTKRSGKRTRAGQDPSDADAPTDPPKRARTTKKWKGDIPFEPSVRPNPSSTQSGDGPNFSSSSDDPTTSDDDDDAFESAVEDHRLYPKAGHGFAPALQPDDHKILEESAESQTFSHSMHGPAKEAKESNDPVPVWPSHK